MEVEKVAVAVKGKPRQTVARIKDQTQTKKEDAKMEQKKNKGKTGKPATTNNEPPDGVFVVSKAYMKKADPKSGVQILLAAVRAAGPKGLTIEEIFKKVEDKIPNKNPKTMIPRTLHPYLTSKGLIEQKGDRFIAKGGK
jgi:hypothetical protein